MIEPNQLVLCGGIWFRFHEKRL